LSERTRRWILATERYSKPLSLARENRECHNREYQLVRADRLCGIQGDFAAILANLPYVFSGSDSLRPSVRSFEPKEALFIPSDPSSFYKIMFDQVCSLLKPEGEAWFEGSRRLFKELKQKVLPQVSTIDWTIQRDESERERFLIFKKS
jgi:methylase of polypeptide subunit release factors